jgi:hypothetical protein
VPNGKRKKFNVYAEMKERCEAKLAEMIAEKKAEIAEKKAKQKEGAELICTVLYGQHKKENLK